MTSPTGIVVFLFTDIEGSTGRWEADRDAMAALVESHDRIISGAVQAHSGVLFSSAGDSHGAAFHTATDAVAAALEAQRGLGGVLPVRMAVHVGPAQERDGDYYGSTLNRGGRLRDAAHGGQVVCSQAVIDLLGDPPIAVDVADLGEHRLRDLSRSERVFQLSGVGLGAAFPALKTLTVEMSNLPVQVNSFVGRYQETAEIEKALHGSRLVTLTGPGGCGKSRLALELAAELFDEFPDGVWLVGLAPVADPDLVPQALATVLGVRERSGVTLTEAAVTYLKRRRLLLVIDNCEHLLDSAADLVAAIVSGTPDVSVLATSREPLHTHGEIIYPVPPLPLPEPDAELVELAHSDSVRLFVERAAAAHPDFHLNVTNAPAVSSICRQLDGIPLAIELAAATTRMLGPDQIEARLGDRFRLLRHGPRGDLPHHQTLEAAIDWSHRLLTPPQQTLFARLAVFHGGWTIDAAEAVCSGNGLNQTDILPLLTDLVDRSLVVASKDGPQPRYRFLETVGVYASEQNGVDSELSLSHAHHYLAFAQQLAPLMETDQTVQAMDSYTADLANLRAALDHFDHTGNATDYCQLLTSMRRFLHIRRMFTDAERWVGRALQVMPDDLDPSTEGQILLFAAFSASRGHFEHPEVVAEFCHRAISPLNEVGDDRHLSEALSWLTGLEEDPTYGDQALQAAIRSGNKDAVAGAHHLLGVHWFSTGDYPAALDHFQRALDAGPGPGLLGFVKEWTGRAHWRLGNTNQALELYDQALKLFELVRDPAGIKNVLEHRLECHLLAGDPRSALQAVRTSIDIKMDYLGGITAGSHAMAAHASIMSGNVEGTLHHLDAMHAIPTDSQWWRQMEEGEIGHAFYAVALVAFQHDDPVTTAMALAAEHTYRTTSMSRGKPTEDYANSLMEQVKSSLGPDDFDAASARGINMTLDEILELALTTYNKN